MAITKFTIRVYGILVNENKRVLVSDEFIRGDYFTKFPGGGMELGEGTRDCLRREFKEETGLDVFGLIPVFSRIDGDYFCVVYIGQWSGEIHKDDEHETGVVEWVDWEELKNGPFGAYNSELQKHLIKLGLINE